MSHTTRARLAGLVGLSCGYVCHCGRGSPANSAGRVCRDSSSPVNVGEVALAVAYYGDRTMATADNTTAEKSMSKTAQIVCYLTDMEEEPIRQVCDRLDDSRDYLAKKESRTTHYRVVRNGVSLRINDDQFERLKAAGVDDMRLIEYDEVNEMHENSKGMFGVALRDRVVEGVDLDSGISGADTWFNRRVRVDDEKIFDVTYHKVTNMGIIKGGKVPDGESVWIDEDAEIPAVVLRIQIEDVTPTQYRWFNESVIPDIVENIKDDDWVADKRTLDCEKEYSESGSCYRL